MSTRPWQLAVGLALLAASAASADPLAREATLREALAAVEPVAGEDIQAYLNRLLARARDVEGATTIEGRTSAIATGPPEAASGNDAMTDLLPTFQLGGGFVTESDEKSITFKFNPETGPVLAVGLAATVVTDPEVHPQLLEAVAEPVRKVQEDAIREGMGIGDDLAVSAELSVLRGYAAGRRRMFGREWSLYEGLARDLGARAFAEVEVGGHHGRGWDELVERLAGDDDAGVLDHELLELPAEDLEFVRIRLVDEAVYLHSVERQLGTWNLHRLGHLVDNQPQVVVTGSYRSRDDRLGPDEFAVEAKYEMGFDNLNSLVGRVLERSGKATFAGALEATDQATKDAVKEAVSEVLAGPQPRDRLAFALSYRTTGRLDVDHAYVEQVSDSTGGITGIPRVASLDLDSARALRIRLHYQRDLMAKRKDEARPVLDLSATYDDVTGDDMLRDRLVAKLGFTIGFANGTSLPLTLTYANHGRYLGEQDQELSAHFGVSFKLGDKEVRKLADGS